MTVHQKFSASLAAFLSFCLVVFPQSFAIAVVAIAAVGLHGFLVLKENVSPSIALEARVKEINDKVQALLLAKGLGR